MSKSFGAPYWLVPQGTRPVHYMDNPGLSGATIKLKNLIIVLFVQLDASPLCPLALSLS